MEEGGLLQKMDGGVFAGLLKGMKLAPGLSMSNTHKGGQMFRELFWIKCRGNPKKLPPYFIKLINKDYFDREIGHPT